MHIGLLAPPWIPIPPPAYGGIEMVVALLARDLARRGDEVTLVAAPGSRVEGARVVAPLHGVPSVIGLHYDEYRHVIAGVEALADCDVVIDHSGLLGALVTAQMGVTSLHVLHGPVTADSAATYAAIARRAPGLSLIAISQAQMRAAPHLPFAGVCYNGLDLDGLPFSATPGDYLVFLGRMSPDKGAVEAIEIARRAGMPLYIAAKCREPDEQSYFERHVAPAIGPDVHWLGEIGGQEKFELLTNARALVFPIAWEEPFGMVMIESMACGTPVLATARGSVPEVVVDGVTGFVREDPMELAAAVARLDEIDRYSCRAHVAARFSSHAMTDAYRALLAPAPAVREQTTRRSAGRHLSRLTAAPLPTGTR